MRIQSANQITICVINTEIIYSESMCQRFENFLLCYNTYSIVFLNENNTNIPFHSFWFEVEINNRKFSMENFPFRSCPREIFFKWKTAFSQKISPHPSIDVRKDFLTTVTCIYHVRYTPPSLPHHTSGASVSISSRVSFAVAAVTSWLPSSLSDSFSSSVSLAGASSSFACFFSTVTFCCFGVFAVISTFNLY